MEFLRHPENLSEKSPDESHSKSITKKITTKAINRMNFSKAARPLDIIAEMLKPTGKAGAVTRGMQEVCNFNEAIFSLRGFFLAHLIEKSDVSPCVKNLSYTSYLVT